MEQTQDGLQIVLTPVQLAAVLQRASISEPEGWGRLLLNRVEGGATLVAGGIELVGAAALVLTPEPTMLTKVGGGILAVHGSDTSSTGMVELWTGRHHMTMTAQAVPAAARNMGYSPDASDNAGAVVDVMVPLVVAGGLGAVRALSVRSGRMALAAEETAATPAARARPPGQIHLGAEEMAGGHTWERHIGRTDAQLRQRLLDEPRIPAATTFRTMEEAEVAISKGLASKSAEIEAWAARAPIARDTLAFTVDAGAPVGQGVVRSTGMVHQMSKIRIVLSKIAPQNKVVFLLTAYPVP